MSISVGQAMLASTGASILSSAFGGSKGGTVNLNMRRERSQRRGLYELAREDWRQRTSEGYVNQVNAAKKAGLHPLFALGQSGAGQSPNFSMPGQASTGSFAKNALASAGAGFQQYALLQAQKDLVEAQNQSAKLAIATQPGNGNDAALGIEQGITRPKLQELKKGEVQAHNPKKREQNLNVKSPMTKFRIGSQDIWFSAEDMEQLADNPLFVFGMAAMYSGNKNVDWAQAWNEYRGAKPTPAQTTRGTQNMFKRLGIKRRNPIDEYEVSP